MVLKNIRKSIVFWAIVLDLTVTIVGCDTISSPAITPSPTPIPPTATPEPLAERWNPGQLEIHVLDVEHGDAQLIISPTGETMLIDGARAEFAPRIAQYLQDALGEVSVDYLLLSHYHVDHIQGIVPLFRDEGLVVRKAVLDRGGDRQEYDSKHYRAYFDYISDPTHVLERVRLYPGDEIDMGPALLIQVLAVGDIDTHSNLGVPIIDDNDNSVALWLSYGKFDYWTAGDLTGVNSIRYADIETAVIPYLPRDVDVYRANHHAINYNSNPAFLEALNPTIAIASTNNEVVGWDTLLRLEECGDVYLTGSVPAHESSGDIVLISITGDDYTVEGRTYSSK